MSPRRSELLALAMLGIVMVFWAGNSIVGRAVRFDIPPNTLAFLRWAGALAIVTPFALRQLRRDRAAILAGWKPILLLGLLGISTFNTLLYAGLHHTSATNALLLQAAIPPLVMVLDWALHRVEAGPWQIGAILLSTLGVLVIVFRGDPAAALSLQFGAGDGLILISVVAWAFYTVLLRYRPPVAPVSFIFTTFAVGVVTLAPLAAWDIAMGNHVRWTPVALGGLAYVAVLPSLVAYFLFNAATARLGPARAGHAITLMPLFGALLSAWLLGEVLEAYHGLGMVLILLGIVAGAFALRPPDLGPPDLRPKDRAGIGQPPSLEDKP